MSNIDLSISPEVNDYWQYVKECVGNQDIQLPKRLIDSIRLTNWEDPDRSLDFNNIAVMALISSDRTDDMSERELYLGFALESLKQGIDNHNCPLCKAHFSLIQNLVGNSKKAIDLSFKYFLEILQEVSLSPETSKAGLIYLPRYCQKWNIVSKESLLRILLAENASLQAIELLLEVVCHSRLCFYTQEGLRFLQLATQFNHNSAILNLQLGIAGLITNYHQEYLAYLHRAAKLSPESPSILQTLYLVYKDLGKKTNSEQWKSIGINYAKQDTKTSQWLWATLPNESQFTYIVFEDALVLTVKASLLSCVTSMILAQGDWFELEMDLWREQIQLGMTVIDIGANVGVYTFSAARRVGKLGKVIAVEPFSECIEFLEETCRINQIDCVKIIAGAASDRNGTATLSVNELSELNELVEIDDSDSKSGKFESVRCLTLDSLIEQENLSRVDWLKIDAEGHEIKVLAGSQRILQEFRPNIMYENTVDSNRGNTQVAEYLIQNQYHLFRYIPYLNQLIPINAVEELQDNLNIIALPVK